MCEYNVISEHFAKVILFSYKFSVFLNFLKLFCFYILSGSIKSLFQLFQWQLNHAELLTRCCPSGPLCTALTVSVTHDETHNTKWSDFHFSLARTRLVLNFYYTVLTCFSLLLFTQSSMQHVHWNWTRAAMCMYHPLSFIYQNLYKCNISRFGPNLK